MKVYMGQYFQYWPKNDAHQLLSHSNIIITILFYQLRFIIDILGEPPKRLLNNGTKTQMFYHRCQKFCFFTHWKFKVHKTVFDSMGRMWIIIYYLYHVSRLSKILYHYRCHWSISVKQGSSQWKPGNIASNLWMTWEWLVAKIMLFADEPMK